jgi:DNA-binding MarR family transcriptional regulator
VAAGWVTLGPGADGRSRMVNITDAGRDKRQEAQRRWKVAQLAINTTLGVANVLALHALMDDCMARLAPASRRRTS